MRHPGRHQSVTTASETYPSSAMLDLVIFLRASFLLAAVAVSHRNNTNHVIKFADSSQALLAHYVPSLRTRFLVYGSRQNGQQPKKFTANLLDALATFQVPHSWFASFYVVSTLCSFIWFSQVLLDQSLWRRLASLTNINKAMTLDQIIVTWVLMLLQGVRRVYECLEFTKPSNARMWIGHWALGVWFYASMSVAVWIEGARRFWSCENPCLAVLTFFPFPSNSAQGVFQFLALDHRASIAPYLCWLLDFYPCFRCAARLPCIPGFPEEVQRT